MTIRTRPQARTPSGAVAASCSMDAKRPDQQAPSGPAAISAAPTGRKDDRTPIDRKFFPTLPLPRRCRVNETCRVLFARMIVTKLPAGWSERALASIDEQVQDSWLSGGHSVSLKLQLGIEMTHQGRAPTECLMLIEARTRQPMGVWAVVGLAQTLARTATVARLAGLN